MARKTKKIVSKVPMFGYKIDIKSMGIHSEFADEEFGAWSMASTHSISDFAVKVGADGYPNVVSPIDIPVGYMAYVVWAVWGSGDSFGFHDGAHSEAVGIFTSDAVAEELVAGLYAADKDRVNNGYSVTTSDGQVFETEWAPWSGYFESLESIDISKVCVTADFVPE